MSNPDFTLKQWNVSVEGWGIGKIVTATRGKALANAWGCDAFSGITFAQFLKIARCVRAEVIDDDFGHPITVDGKPAFFISKDRAQVSVAFPRNDGIFSSHPTDVLPERFRPDAYQTNKERHA